MLRFLPGVLKGAITLLLIVISTVGWCSLVFLLGLMRWAAPASSKPMFTSFMSVIANCWIMSNNLFLDLFQELNIKIDNQSSFGVNNWYLVVSNHQTWADILILQRIFIGQLPMLKFFVKQQLIWVPVIGIAWWALDFPFMNRYSKAQLEARPELRGQDLATTRRACEVFKTAPVAVLNFLEGTRFTPQKKHSQGSPFHHLLQPRSGGAALVLNVMGSHIDSLVNVTIVYPQGAPGFWEFLCGRTGEILITVQQQAIPAEMCNGDYEQDEAFKVQFQSWINDLWVEKDTMIGKQLTDV